jgi:hypothetical protein
MVSALRICWNIIPLVCACIAFTFTLLVIISGTSANNGLSDIYFMRVCHLSVPSFRVCFNFTLDEYDGYYTRYSSSVARVQHDRTELGSTRFLSELALGLL